ncbi:28048_t:CDS:1, partial [Dentiscutata erythropus]
EIDDLIEVISKNSTMTSLVLLNNCFGFKEVKTLAETIHKTTTLTSLHFYE